MFTNYQYFVYFHIKTAEAIFIFYSYCGNDVIACCFISKQHPYLTTHPPPPRLVCGTRLTGARLLSVQVNQTPSLYAGPGVYLGPGFYPKFYGKYDKSQTLYIIFYVSAILLHHAFDKIPLGKFLCLG